MAGLGRGVSKSIIDIMDEMVGMAYRRLITNTNSEYVPVKIACMPKGLQP